MMRRGLTAALAGGCLLACLASGGSMARAASIDTPGLTVSSNAFPSEFAPGGTGDFEILVRNAGSKPTNGTVTVTDELPAGLSAEFAKGEELSYALAAATEPKPPVATMGCVTHGRLATCTLVSTAMAPGAVLSMDVHADVSATVVEGVPLTNSVLVQGGEALPARASEQVPVGDGSMPYGLQSFSFQDVAPNGLTDQQAGDHPYESTVSYFLNTNHVVSEGLERSEVAAKTRNFVVDLPKGLVGNPQIVPKCPLWRANQLSCPLSTQVGVAMVFTFDQHPGTTLFQNTSVEPIYNVAPEPGEPAQFQFDYEKVPIALHVTVSPETADAVRVSVLGVPNVAKAFGVMATFFGTPQSDSNVYNHNNAAQPLAFLTNPVDCADGPSTASVFTDSRLDPGAFLPTGAPDLADLAWKRATTTVYPAITGCEQLNFDPSLQLIPDTTEADEPTGVTARLHIPQAPDASPDLLTPELDDATVTLPAGLTVSPSAADGLQACSDAQFAEESSEPATCPTASVLGSVKIVTPLLEAPLEGQVFLGAPECTGPGGICTAADVASGRQLRIFLEASGSGVRIKREGRIYANPSTGQLTTKFVENPQLPFETLELHFNGGLRAGLATPQTCGPATTTTDFSAWSSPFTADATPTSVFDVDWNGAGGVCPAIWPFAPSFSAGTSNPDAGQYSPFTLTFGREDREQDLSQIQVQMPPGLIGKLSGVTLCGEPQASQGTCAESSRIGSITAAAGAGAHPFYEKGEIYLTGAYKGAPFGLSIVVPTVAGPFNLGNVVVRSSVYVNPRSAALTVTSDPFPQIIDGIPLRLRTANVTIERPEFIRNPTDCERQQISATINGSQGTQAHVSAPFAVAGCAGLPLQPTFSAYTSAEHTRRSGASLFVKVAMPKGADANVTAAKVELPKLLPSRLETLKHACLAPIFEANPADCDAGSIVGVARVHTPILPVPLVGPVYFVSDGAAKFPELVVVLQGYGIRVDLHAKTFINEKSEITSSTFTNLPDVPFSSFELDLPRGAYSALAAPGNLCYRTLVKRRRLAVRSHGRLVRRDGHILYKTVNVHEKVRRQLFMPTTITGQNGAVFKQRTEITVSGCTRSGG